MTVHAITDAHFAQEIQSGVTLVDFWASWCGPCQIMIPRLGELAEAVPQAKICKMDVEENNATASQFGIMSIPTLLVFKEGKLVEKKVGVHEVSDLKSLLEKHL